MRYDQALRHTSSVWCLETFRTIYAITLPQVRSNSWNVQLAVLNDPRHAQLEKMWGSGRPKKGCHGHTAGLSWCHGSILGVTVYCRQWDHIPSHQMWEWCIAVKQRQSSFLVRFTTPNRRVDEWASRVGHVMSAVILNVLQPGIFVWFEKSQGPLVKVLPVPGWRPIKQLAVLVHFLRCSGLLDDC
ncbi:uncharacterized protein TNCV_1350651 [Trichonephila clavipes]|nr:uncharacterized protein TNCV_1350651 [Trichonephila clavipes]